MHDDAGGVAAIGDTAASDPARGRRDAMATFALQADRIALTRRAATLRFRATRDDASRACAPTDDAVLAHAATATLMLLGATALGGAPLHLADFRLTRLSRPAAADALVVRAEIVYVATRHAVVRCELHAIDGAATRPCAVASATLDAGGIATAPIGAVARLVAYGDS